MFLWLHMECFSRIVECRLNASFLGINKNFYSIFIIKFINVEAKWKNIRRKKQQLHQIKTSPLKLIHQIKSHHLYSKLNHDLHFDIE